MPIISMSARRYAEHSRRVWLASLVTEALAREAIGRLVLASITNVFGDVSKLAPLAEATQTERARLGYSENDPLLRSGELRNSLELAMRDGGFVVGTNDERMVWLEYGYAPHNLPPRPAIGIGIQEITPVVQRVMYLTVQALARGDVQPLVRFLAAAETAAASQIRY